MPILDANTLEVISRSPEQTRRVGMRLGSLLQAGDIVHLIGDLGSGKTTLVQGIAVGWGSLDVVSSPTFVLVNVYRRPDGILLNHLDAYRLNDALEAEDLDVDTMIEQGVLLVEWADRIRDALPQRRLEVDLHWMADEQRSMVFSAQGDHYQRMLAELKRLVFGGG
jgi:tRNA threonylcarbamoyladenosine biosynthesis protein TsaE